ncbi:hypothetical protein UF64_15850 [Thalassospira sp. HJ]|uniref:type IV toxin-antitoxin system AbiEi family antitoxin domain-containing protein n=1 Tax=Thalassospira sp. HJ TaxID=1616823 RepID=UPI0005CF1186|nr:hypothetical protein [Thalassospira sp. HJ]KJE33927.1 hypothetical protein UF64_15850 [Thalassospira sp. HJ]
MNFTDALEEALLARDLPIITFYDFFVLGQQIFFAKKWGDSFLKRLPHNWDYTRARNAIKRMEERKALVPDSNFRSFVWRVTQSTRAGSAEEIICISDPFSYVSHLSAMHIYGLTNRNPEALQITTPKRKLWNSMQEERIKRDLPSLATLEPKLMFRPHYKQLVRRRKVSTHTTSSPWKPTKLAGEETRITTIGQTFADMLLQPALCGGMRHVLDIWAKESTLWVDEIIEAINTHKSKIIKVRAGYIFTEVLELSDPRVTLWQTNAQRGGSQKLDPENEYSANYSETWMISINVD